jgi:uncharacterized protein YdaU (DUF1376 family)
MADLPYMKFFPADWLADCDVLSVSARGAWQTFLCKAWLARSASITLKIPQWCRVFGATNAEQAERVIAEIEECDVGDVMREDDGRVTLISRRIERDLVAMGATQKKRSDAARLAAESRWKAERMRDACESHTESNADAMRNDAILEGRSQKPDVSITQSERAHEIPTVEQVKAYAASAPVPITEVCAVAFYDTQQAGGWITKHGHSIADWRAALRRYAALWNENEKSKPVSKQDHRQQKAAAEFPEPDKPALPRA